MTKTIIEEVKWFIKPSKNLLVIRKYIIEVTPKEKFVRRCERRKTLEKIDLGVYEIPVPFTVHKEKRSRSWLGDGFQNDDINCFEEWEEDVKVYNEPDLSNFIKEKMKLI